MNEQQKGQYNALLLQQSVYKKQVSWASKILSNAIEAHFNNPTIFTEYDKSQAESNLAGYHDDLYHINLKIEAFLENL